MGEQKQDRQPPTFRQAFTFESNLPQLKSTACGFRVPILTDSDEEELLLWEERVGKLERSPSARPRTVDSQTSPASISLGSDIKRLSQLGDFTSLFPPSISTGESPSRVQRLNTYITHSYDLALLCRTHLSLVDLHSLNTSISRPQQKGIANPRAQGSRQTKWWLNEIHPSRQLPCPQNRTSRFLETSSNLNLGK